MKTPSRCIFTTLIMLLLFVLPGTGYGADDALFSPVSDEERGIDAAVRQYLDAEVARNLKAVYDCLAPSSIYRTTHDYDAYLSEAGASPVRIREYRILRIAHIRVNEDRQRFPHVEKFAEVEVDMHVHFIDTNQAAEVNFNFTFIMEGGRWYKG